MFQFVLTTLLMMSLGTMLYLIARSLPRIEEEASGKQNFLDRLASSEIPEKIDAAFNGFLLKSLRKSKVVLMKLDNFVNDKLKKASPNGKNKPSVNENIDFKELAETTELSEGIDPVRSRARDKAASSSGTAGAATSNGIEKSKDSENN